MGVVRRPLVGQRSGTQCRCLRYQACNLEQGTFDKNRIIGDKKYSRYRLKVIADIRLKVIADINRFRNTIVNPKAVSEIENIS